MVEIRLRFVHKDKSRHGQTRYYFRRAVGSPKIRLPAKPGDAAFHDKYSELLLGATNSVTAAGGCQPGAPAKALQVGTLHFLAAEYFRSSAFKHLNASTKKQRRWVIESMLQESVKPSSPMSYGDVRLKDITAKALRILRDRKSDLTGAANYRVKVLRQWFRWALEEEHLADNPARDLSNIKRATKGIHPWTVEEVEKFEQAHPIGTKARLALALLLWTGVRRSDVVCLGRQHVRQGWLRFLQVKNRERRPVQVEIPILPQLQSVLDRSPVGELTFLINDYGRPYTVAGFGMRMREWCDKAGLEGCSAHGLRKAGAATAAENGATPHQLMAIFGWLSLAEAERYTREAKRRKMAGEAMGLLVRQEPPHF